MKISIDDIKRIIEYKKKRLEYLAQPENWIRYTKNMECGEEREFKQSCIDDEIIIEALEKRIQKKVTEKDEEIGSEHHDYYLSFICPACNESIYGQPYRPNYCKHCGQALIWDDHPTEKGGEDDA